MTLQLLPAAINEIMVMSSHVEFRKKGIIKNEDHKVYKAK